METPAKGKCRFWSPVRLAAGWLLVPIGLLITPLPIPVGLLLVAVGFALLVRESRPVRRWVRRLRARFPGFSTTLKAMERRAPEWIRRWLRRTDPGASPRPRHPDSGQA